MNKKSNQGQPPIKVVRCGHCSHVYRIRIGHKTWTKCEKCGQNIGLPESFLTGAMKRQALDEIYQRKKARLDAKYGTALRKQSQVPVTPEAKFRTRAIDKGYKVYRPIWPDNIIEKDGKIAFVEVKSADDIVSPEQALTFDLLEKHGIPVYVWQDAKESSGSFVRWGNGVEAKRNLCGGREIDSHAYNRFCESLGQQGEVVV